MSEDSNGSNGTNGYYKELRAIQAGVDEIRDDLSRSVDTLTVAVTNLTAQVSNLTAQFSSLTNQFTQLIRAAENVIPIKAVMWMFGILVLTMVGVEGVVTLAKYSKGIM
jgi:hypothetical protein